MTRRLKSLHSCTLLALLSLAAICNADAAEPGSDYRTRLQISACIAEVSRHADYTDASRVIHWIEALVQKNIAELEISAVTSVYAEDPDSPVREYNTVCVTDSGGGIVKFGLQARE